MLETKQHADLKGLKSMSETQQALQKRLDNLVKNFEEHSKIVDELKALVNQILNN